MADLRDRFINEHFGKSVEDLWNEFKTAIDQFSTQCIPTKLIRGKSSFPWITQEIRRMIRKRDHIYRRFKKTGAQETRIKFCNYGRKSNTKLRHHTTYILKGSLDLMTAIMIVIAKGLSPFLKTQGKTSLAHPR